MSLGGDGGSASVRVDHGVSSGTFNLDGQTFEVENNIWVIGDDDECVVIDAPHSVDDIMVVVGARKVNAILLTHAHDDHCLVAPELRERVAAPIMLHPEDRPLWDLVHTDRHWNVSLSQDEVLHVAGVAIHVLHTPGHAPGAVCFYVPDLGCLFTGDTLFHGGPGATGRSFSDKPTLLQSIQSKLFALPGSIIVHPGHGDSTTIEEERIRLQVGVPETGGSSDR